MIRNGLLCLGALVLSLLLGEAIVRSLGRAPELRQLPLRVTPPDARLYTPDDELGYALAPNADLRIDLVGTPRKVEFSVRTDDLGRRWTRAPADAGASRKPEIWIFGCSFTFGWLVDDDESYPWLLQQRFPSFSVRNYGVGGYGTLQSLLQYKRALRRSGPPQVAILAYARFHDERNVMSPLRRKQLGSAWTRWGEVRQPYMRWLGGGRFETLKSAPYRPYVPLVEYSALANLLDTTIVREVERRHRLEDHRQEISRHLVDEFQEESRRHGVTFAVGQLDAPLQMVEYARSRGIPAADMSLSGKPAFVFAGDGHPNDKGHRFLADRAAALITRLTGVAASTANR